MSIKQISVFLENQPGTLNGMTELLAKNNIDMRALSLSETTDFGIARVIVDKVEAAAAVLSEAGFIYRVAPVLAVAIPDEPGGLNRVLQLLTAAQINVEYMYAFLGGAAVQGAYMIFQVQDEATAAKALAEAGIGLANQEELAQL